MNITKEYDQAQEFLLDVLEQEGHPIVFPNVYVKAMLAYHAKLSENEKWITVDEHNKLLGKAVDQAYEEGYYAAKEGD